MFIQGKELIIPLKPCFDMSGDGFDSTFDYDTDAEDILEQRLIPVDSIPELETPVSMHEATVTTASSPSITSQVSKSTTRQQPTQAAAPEAPPTAPAAAAISQVAQATAPEPERPQQPAKRAGIKYELRCPTSWTKMPHIDKVWIGQTLFRSKDARSNSIIENLDSHWFYPPTHIPKIGEVPNLDNFRKPAFVWMPEKTYAFQFKCTADKCDKKLTHRGAYKTVLEVVGLSRTYWLIGSRLMCDANHDHRSWDCRLLEQLPSYIADNYPILHTYRYALDKEVVVHMRSRTLGNSITALRNVLYEQHSENHLRSCNIYLGQVERYNRYKLPYTFHEPSPPPKFDGIQSKEWFTACYMKDVALRMPFIQSQLTSVFGEVLKIDSTKKTCKKLQGHSAGTMSWMTNVGNECGEILMSVATASESVANLEKMAQGLIDRYRNADVNQPNAIYTDRDCCATGKVADLFANWTSPVRLDIWHFMRRFEQGTAGTHHPLYGTFLGRLSDCIFEWDSSDYALLLKAKKSQLKSQHGHSRVSDKFVKQNLNRQEIARHCKRQTRGPLATERLIEELIFTLKDASSELGAPFILPTMEDILATQRRHLICIQDPPHVNLYTRVGFVKKGGINLPVYRCARGSTSLESFHLYLNRFIPGTSASPLHFQAYLLEGLYRWNTDRRKAATPDPVASNYRSYDPKLMNAVNTKYKNLFQDELFPALRLPEQYTGEKVGMDYLLDQANSLDDDDLLELAAESDEGFEDVAATEAAFVAAHDVNTLTDPDAAMDEEQQTSAATELQLVSTLLEQPNLMS